MNVYDSILQEVAEQRAVLANYKPQRIEEPNQREIEIREDVESNIKAEGFKYYLARRILSQVKDSKHICLCTSEISKRGSIKTKQEALFVVYVLREHGFLIDDLWYESYNTWGMKIRVKD